MANRSLEVFPVECRAALVALALAAGCAAPTTQRPGVSEVGPRVRGPGPAIRDTAGRVPADAGLHRKRVSEKEPPVTLIAGDGSRCEVSADRFERRKVGDRVWCVWRAAGASDR